MSKEKLGQEPAFAYQITLANGEMVESIGMSKRFYAASIVLQGLCANPKNTKIGSNLFIRAIQLFFPKINIVSTIGNCKDMVSIAYDMADELLKQEQL